MEYHWWKTPLNPYNYPRIPIYFLWNRYFIIVPYISIHLSIYFQSRYGLTPVWKGHPQEIWANQRKQKWENPWENARWFFVASNWRSHPISGHLQTGVGKCPNVSHHPTIGDIISNRYGKVMFKIEGTVPYFWPYFWDISPYVALKNRPYIWLIPLI